MIDYLAISNTLLLINASIENAVGLLGRSEGCKGHKDQLAQKNKEIDDAYMLLKKNLNRYSEGSEKYLSIVANMKYGFKEDLNSESSAKCLFPTSEISEFIRLINEIDLQIFDVFKRIGDIKASIVKIGKMCANPEEKLELRKTFEGVDVEIERLISEKPLFDHPVDEIENALPIDFSPEDKKFIDLLVECTTEFPEKLADSLHYIVEAGRPYNW